MPKYYGSNRHHVEVSKQPLTPTQQYKQDHLKDAMAGKLRIPTDVLEAEKKRQLERRNKKRKRR